VFTDLDETWHARVRNGVLNARQGVAADAQLTVSGPKQALVAAMLQPAAASQLVTSGTLTLDGDAGVLSAYAALLDEVDMNLPIVTP